MPARRDTRCEAARVHRVSPLQTIEDQSQAWGEGFAPSWKLSYKVNNYLAVYPEAAASFRPTDRTSMNAVLICQPCAASPCSSVDPVIMAVPLIESALIAHLPRLLTPTDPENAVEVNSSGDCRRYAPTRTTTTYSPVGKESKP